jgi:hypothetical protein
MNEIIEQLRSQHDFQKAEEKRLKNEIFDIHCKQREIVREYCQRLTEQYSQYLNKKVTIKRYNGREVVGFFCGFIHGYNDLSFEAYVDLAKIKKDGSPSANHYKYYDTAEYSDNLKITVCNE